MKNEAREELMLDDVSLDNPNDFEDDKKEFDKLLKKHEELHNYFKKKLDKKDYIKLNKLLEQERELTLREE